MNTPLKIGTRKSPLALWQAYEVENKLQNLGYTTKIIPIISSGDKDLTQPIYQMGITGVFTKDLDIALLNGEIDLAVHSLKDVPTILPKNVQLSAVLARDYQEDILIRNPKIKSKGFSNLLIGSSSLRRRSFWKNTYPNTKFNNIRGNVQTRLQRMEDNNFDGVIFSYAGIKRLNLPYNCEALPFLLPAPGQGVIAVASLNKNEITSILKKINHTETEICISTERQFLHQLEGGCVAPIGAYAKKITDEKYLFSGAVCSLDGKIKLETELEFSSTNYTDIGKIAANKLIEQGAKEIITQVRNSIK